MSEKIIGGAQGVLNFNGGNEVELDSYPSFNDPVMFRRGMKITAAGGGGGCDSFDNIPNGPGGRRVQMVLIHGEQSETVRGQEGNPKGSWSIFANDGNGEGDANMPRMMRLEASTGVSARDGSLVEAFYLGEAQWESLVRQLSARLGGSGGAPSRFVSPNGRYWCQPVQDDGNGVTYDASDPNNPKAIFDMWWLMQVLAELGKHYPR